MYLDLPKAGGGVGLARRATKIEWADLGPEVTAGGPILARPPRDPGVINITVVIIISLVVIEAGIPLALRY
jgi:hypothetical protein